MNSQNGSQVLLAGAGIELLELRQSGADERRVVFRAGPGLYQFNLYLDAAEFDWESLYQEMNVNQNQNQRTGPWDFDYQTARPLVPAYRVSLDGHALGLWYVQRVSLADLEHKHFRGRLAFLLDRDGEHELIFEPYKPARVEWVHAWLEPDPEDRLNLDLGRPENPFPLPAARFAEPEFWLEQSEKLKHSHQVYQQPLKAMLQWLRQANVTGNKIGLESAMPLLAAAWNLEGDKEALAQALQIIDEAIRLPAWGRPDPDAYGHNGDIGGSATFINLAWAWHMFAPWMGQDRQNRLRDKLVLQGQCMLEQILLMRDYWGGSLLQDHGRKSVHDFGAAALHLWGEIPEADLWVAYIIPRIERGLATAPRDGVIPGSSYNSLHMYTDSLMKYREALLARTGRDLLDHESLANVPEFVASVYDAGADSLLLVECNDSSPLNGGGHFMEAMAARGNPHAALIASRLREAPETRLKSGGAVAAYSIFWGFLAHDPASARLELPVRPVRDLRFYDDSGFVHYRDSDLGVALSIKCGSWLGYHAHRRAGGPCDRMEMLPGAGHFSLYLDGQSALVSPDTGYRLISDIRSCMLVDGRGQTGSTGYPMSVPSQPHRGDRIESVEWDGASGRGLVRLDLQPAYPAEAGVAFYRREFHFAPGNSLRLREIVTLFEPRTLAWLFQFKADAAGQMQNLCASLESPRRLCITPVNPGIELTGKMAPTEVVYSYASKFNRFQHFRYETAEPVSAVILDFLFELPLPTPTKNAAPA